MHLFYFSKGSLKTLLRNAGFELITTESYVHYASVRHVFNGGLAATGGERVLPILSRTSKGAESHRL
jgi:hypothetical protein